MQGSEVQNPVFIALATHVFLKMYNHANFEVEVPEWT